MLCATCPTIQPIQCDVIKTNAAMIANATLHFAENELVAHLLLQADEGDQAAITQQV